jgi:hypothetical protein
MNKRDEGIPNQSDTNDFEKADDSLRREERSLDIGESGQFAPGGYYNQQGVNEPRRTLDDDDIILPARRSRNDSA